MAANPYLLPEREVIHVCKSPMNPKIKIARLSCGHDVFRNRAPRVGAKIICDKCPAAGHERA